MPEAPVPAVNLPWRTMTFRAVEHSAGVEKHEHDDCPMLHGDQGQCKCFGAPLERSMTMNSRVQRWVSVQQEQYIEEQGAGTQDLPVRPAEVWGPRSARLSLGCVSVSSRAPTLGNGAFLTGDLAREILGSLAPSMRLTQLDLSAHNEACPRYEDAPVPEYREVDPNPAR